ncbi:MAG TPA: hypothetical protein VMV05_04520, partial [bacterium]|nr:hypothetical protein [bacterium]
MAGHPTPSKLNFFRPLKLKTFSTRFYNLLKPVLSAAVIGGIFSSAQATSLQLHISGNQIINSSGCTVRLKGADVSGLEYSNIGDGGTGRPTTTINGVTMTDYVSIITELVTVWHANCVRFPINQDYWFGCTNSYI